MDIFFFFPKDLQTVSVDFLQRDLGNLFVFSLEMQTPVHGLAS